MIKVINWEDAIKNGKYDKEVGIGFALLTQTDNFYTYITKIDPYKCVKAHFHKYDNEHYHIINGAGKLRVKDMVNVGKEEIIMVSRGESFVIPANVLHELTNVAEEPLILMFSCQRLQIDIDRYFA